MDFIKLLREYWFSEREAKIYLTCLEFGEDIPSSIARRAKENRVTTYSILKDLAKKWIATELTKNNKKYYSVISPQKLLNKEKAKYDKLSEAIPILSAITSEYAHKPKIYIYEGYEWLKEVYEEMLSSATTIYWFRYSSINKEFDKYILEEFIPKRIQKNIKIKNIISKELYKKVRKLWKKNEEEFFREIRTINKPFFDLKNDILIYWEDKILVGIFDKKELYWLSIESKSLHNSLKSIYEALRQFCTPT